MNRNYLKYILIGGVSIFVWTGCDDYLNRESTSGVNTPDLIWQNPKAITAVLADMYDSGLKPDEFDDRYGSKKANLANQTSLSDEATAGYQKESAFDKSNSTYSYGDYVFNDDMVTRYKQIRIVNNFLLNIEKTSVLSEDEKEELGAEARFIRAMQYFDLVKRYGGVPLQTVPKEYTAGNTEALYQARDTEAATYDFIINECKAIYESLPEVRSSDAKYRANRGTVLALWSRAALYAGTIAKYSKTLTLTGEAVSKGYVYIPETEAERYFDECYTASSKILDEMVPRVYSLYKSTGTEAEELAQNFYNLFSKAVNGDNGEYIFQKQYNVAAGKGHMWDKLNVPFSYRGDGWGCGMSPVMEMVEEFEYIDGTEGKLKMKDSSGKAISYDSPYDIFKNKDPRLLGSVYLPGADYKGYGGGKIEWIRGVINGQDGIGTKYEASAQPDKENKVVIDGQTYNTSGKDGGSLSVGDASKTGFYQRKFLDESLTDYTNIDAKRSSTPWVVFRLAEIYLNRAEACMELNRHLDVALKDINEIRGRAGIKLLTAGNLTLDKVRHERKVELAFEKHRYLGFETLAPGSSRCKQRWFDQFPRHGSLSVLQC
ncbi:RagB/SusD family nutrient uptake outer membrane protein [Bacteroides xylanisolvens]|nr:RagB/SusD family nutrient uptake outer membrane protein [Bacteroides xylanisolvens]